MVLFVDLEDESGNSSDPLDNDSMPHHWSHQLHIREGLGDLPARPSVQEVVERTNPNKNAMTEAMGCYPYVVYFFLRQLLALLGLHIIVWLD